jgi:hypothetical protein
MPESSFMTVKSWLRTAADRLDIPLTSRQAHKVTNAYITILSDEEYDRMHADPTGETAVRNVMAWMAAKQVAA